MTCARACRASCFGSAPARRPPRRFRAAHAPHSSTRARAPRRRRYASLSSQSYISFQWFTGTFGKLGEGSDTVLIRLYIDGETTPSLSYFPYELAGTPSVAAYNTSVPARTWSAELWGRNSATSWINSFPVPFSASVRITLQFTGASGAATTYYQAHGLDGVAPSFGRVPLPAGARLVLQRNDLVLDRLAYLNVSSFASGGGLVAAISIAFVAPNLNTLEGCFHFYPAASAPFPGQLHSTGTEDEFISSYYYDLGPFQSKSAGLFYKQAAPGGNTAIAMWRSYQDDPQIFNDGGSFVWRNGDTSDPATGIKCMIQSGGVPAGNPQPAAVQTLSWNYVW